MSPLVFSPLGRAIDASETTATEMHGEPEQTKELSDRGNLADILRGPLSSTHVDS